jgi:hypothetical protein
MKTRHQIFIARVFAVITVMFLAHNLMANGSEITKQIIRTDALLDPIFGISYRPSEIRFQSALSDVYNCKELATRKGDLFLFGESTKGNIHFYLVSGWIEIHTDGLSDNVRRFEAQSDSGIIAIISPGGCRTVGAGYAWSTEKRDRQEAEKYGVTEDVASALLADAVNREVQAFGGRAEFFRRLGETGIDESTLPAQVRAILSVLRRGS